MGMSMKRGLAAVAGGVAVLLLASCGGGAESRHGRVELQAMKADAAAFQGRGTWWNPAEPGTGFFFEAQGPTGVVTFFVFDPEGRPTWVSAAGSMTSQGAGFRFQGTLLRYTGGQAVDAPLQRTPVSQAVGEVTIVFDGESAQVTLPKRSFTARKFVTGNAAGGGLQPETGIYWEPDQSGRGYAVETIGSSLAVTMFHYDDRGQPTWNLSVAPLRGGATTAPFHRYVGGQTLDGPFTVAPGSPLMQGSLHISFTDACHAQLQLRAVPVLSIRRFAFGTLAPGAECAMPARTASEGAAAAGQQSVLVAAAPGLVQPAAVAVDAAGNTWVADEAAHTILKITRDGTTSIVAGFAGARGFAGGPGTQARFAAPTGIAVDAQGVVYVADRDNNAIRKIATDGTVSTLAGLPGQVVEPVNGPLASARFKAPTRLQVDRQGNVYVTEGATIRRIGTDGMVTTFLGHPAAQRQLGDGVDAGFSLVQSLAIDGAGNVYVLELDTASRTWIRKFDAAGRWVRMPQTEDGTLPLPAATDLSVDADGNLYVTTAGPVDSESPLYEAVYKVTAAGTITLYGGSVVPNYAVPSPYPRRLGNAGGIALDPGVAGGGRAIVTDRGGRVWRLLR